MCYSYKGFRFMYLGNTPNFIYIIMDILVLNYARYSGTYPSHVMRPQGVLRRCL